MGKRKKSEKFLKFLDENYAEAECSLVHNDPFELLVATVLSAQCTDVRVNKVTEILFEEYPNPGTMAEADLNHLMEIVRPTGFYKNKASSIKGLSQKITDEYGGRLPLDLDKLTALPGVGRKTANVVIGNFAEAVGIVVDTHVKRITLRLGLVDSENPEKIEKQLMDLVPKERWNKFGHQVIDFGRNICNARNPKCDKCGMADDCDYYKKMRA